MRGVVHLVEVEQQIHELGIIHIEAHIPWEQSGHSALVKGEDLFVERLVLLDDRLLDLFFLHEVRDHLRIHIDNYYIS